MDAAEAAPEADLSVRLGSLRLRNPVMPASGCFGPQLAPLVDLNQLGALVTKTVFADRRAGNPAHRLDETPHGMLNSVGIPSPGIDAFLADVLPRYLAWSPPTVVSLGGLMVEEYWHLAEHLAAADPQRRIGAFELNVSCPNLEEGGLEIGSDPRLVERVTRGVVERSHVPVIVKLTPNVTSIAEIALAAESGGATALTVANTFVGMTIDVRARTPVLGNGVGGLSGPAVHPLILRLAWTTARAVHIPVIGCGGIASGHDAIAFLIAGASAVQVGTATFTRPDAMLRILAELAALLDDLGARSVSEIVGSVRTESRPPPQPELTFAHDPPAATQLTST